MALTESVRSFHVPATPGTIAWPPSLPSVPTSRATRVTSDANERNCSTMVLMVSLSCRISPRTSTVILRERSPVATAMVTSAMLRTWLVRLLAIELTLSVKSFGGGARPRGGRGPLCLRLLPSSAARGGVSDQKAVGGAGRGLVGDDAGAFAPKVAPGGGEVGPEGKVGGQAEVRGVAGT